MKEKIAILYGGPSSEYEVSKSSASNVLANIDREIYEPIEIHISKDGLFEIVSESQSIGSAEEAIQIIKDKCDIIFPVLHGSFGEDGTLQAVLEREHIPFVGSGSTASRIAIDKNAANALYEKNGLSVPRSQIISKQIAFETELLALSIDFPIIIKPISEGSSVGLYRCDSLADFNNQKDRIFASNDQMLAQELIKGREFTCGVLELDGRNVALPASEIVLEDSALFDYDAKYSPEHSNPSVNPSEKNIEITPAEIPSDLMSQIQAVALKCHEILGCKSVSRTDMILAADGKLYVLETNTLPGMTKTSFIPAQAQAQGLSIKELVTALIRSART